MIQLCWSHSVECKMATRSYLGFTVKATKPKLRFMRPLCNIQLFFPFFCLGSYTTPLLTCLQE